MAQQDTPEQTNIAAAFRAVSVQFRTKAWDAAYQGFAELRQATDLDPKQLEQFGTAAYLTGREDAFLSIFEQAFDGYSAAGNSQRASRCAFWIGLTNIFRGEYGRGGGWFAKAHSLLAELDSPCVETGYLMLPLVEQHLAESDRKSAKELAQQAVEIALTFGDEELLTIARHQLGRIALADGDLTTGFALLDELMLSVISDRLWPVATGLMYCSVIDACQEVLEYGRTREWTRALSNWCAQQPQMLAFTGRCMIHRAESRQITGDWRHAEQEAQSACLTLSSSPESRHAGLAHYQLGEIHRLRGAFKEAEDCYVDASRCGCDPQPGLSLLRLQQGRAETASSGLRRALATLQAAPKRIRLLLPLTEVMIATGDLAAAARYADELTEHAATFTTRAVRALERQAVGHIHFANGRADAAIVAFQEAADIWQQLDASYNTAVARVLVGRACATRGDTEGGLLHLRAAQATFAKLKAKPDLQKAERLLLQWQSSPSPILTPRQLSIVRQVAEGRTNREIAAKFGLSERTVDRHISNILMRLDVPNRSAAVRFAVTHGLLTD